MTVDETRPADRTALGAIVRSTATTPSGDRRSIGVERRADVPLEAHAYVPAAAGRPDPVAVLTDLDHDRIPELVPIRHGRMSASPFAFYRGAAAVMASDLATTPSSGVPVQLCGDAHLANFGLFLGPDRRMVFDLNDFDETLPGPFEWDVKRLAASIVLAGRENEISEQKTTAAAVAAVARYRRVIDEVAGVDPLALHYYRLEVDDFLARLDDSDRRRTERAVAKAKRKNHLRAFEKLTERVDGRRRIIDDPPLVTRLDVADDATRLDVRAFLDDYLTSLPTPRRRVVERYRLVDVAHKVVGVGSVGTRCFIALFETADGDPLFLQLKEAKSSVLEPFLGASGFHQAGQRVVEGQRLLQAAGDVFLGWARFASQVQHRTFDFYVRQLWDGKASAAIDQMGGRRLRLYGETCGGALALAHARTGDAALIAGYLGDDDTFDRAIAAFAASYADLTEHDHERHAAAIAGGMVPAVRDI